jgi:hypothetical protein
MSPIGPGRGLACSGASGASAPAPPFAGLKWYHDARTVAALGIGASVPALVDLTGHGYDLSEASGATQPTFAVGNSISFSGSQQLSIPANADLLPNGPWTMFAILTSDATASQRAVMSVSDVGVTQGAAFGVRNSKWSFVDEGVGTFDSVGAFPAATKTLLLFERDGGGTDALDIANFNLYADGVLVATAPRSHFKASASRIWIGRRANGTAFWKGKFNCGGAVDRLLSAGERTTLLNLKNGTTFG